MGYGITPHAHAAFLRKGLAHFMQINISRYFNLCKKEVAMKKITLAMLLCAVAFPLIVNAEPVYRMSDSLQIQRLRGMKRMTRIIPLENLTLQYFQSFDSSDDIGFTWLNDQGIQKVVNLQDRKAQGGKPESYNLAGLYQPTQDEKAVLDYNLAKGRTSVQQMVSTLQNILSAYNVIGGEYYMVVYDDNWNEMNTPTSPLIHNLVKKCVPNPDYYGDDVNFYFQLIGMTPQDTLFNQSNHGYFKVILDRSCNLKASGTVLYFGQAARVTINPNGMPRVDGQVRLGANSRFMSPALEALLEDLAARGFPNL